MSCLEVRDWLPEHALGVLPAEQNEVLERHLESCPGCRKESDDLRQGAAVLALSLPPVDPPSSLGTRVVDRVGAARRTRPQPLPPIRKLLAATLAAAVLAVSALGWAFAERRRAEDVTTRASTLAAQHQRLIDALKSFGAKAYEARLRQMRGDSRAYGYALIYGAPGRGFILVKVLPPPRAAGPYRVELTNDSGQVLSGGRLTRTNTPEWIFYEESGKDLSRGTWVSVLDGSGRAALIGPVEPAADG